MSTSRRRNRNGRISSASCHDWGVLLMSVVGWKCRTTSRISSPVVCWRNCGADWSKVPLPPPGGAAFTGQRYGLPYLYNIANYQVRAFYEGQGLTDVTPAFETHRPKGDALLMQCRHCLRYSLGCCVRNGGGRPQWKEPLFLRLGDGRRFRLDFDCKHCQMNVYAAD